jgi:hypothetical protein
LNDAVMTPRSGMCLQAEMTSLSGGGSPMIMTQLSSGANLQGWIFLLESDIGNVGHFYSVVNGAGTSLVATAHSAYAQNVPQTVKQCTTGGSQRVWLDAQLVVNLTSTVLDGAVGTVGLRDGGSSPADGSWDDVVVTRSNSVSIAGLPAGYSLRVAGLYSLVETPGATATVDLRGLKFPIAKIEILDVKNAMVKELAPSDGVWGGDRYSLNGVP